MYLLSLPCLVFSCLTSSFPSLSTVTTFTLVLYVWYLFGVVDKIPSTHVMSLDVPFAASSSTESVDTVALTTWREKIESSSARSRKVRGGNYVQLATVDHSTMEPRSRCHTFDLVPHVLAREIIQSY
jgi:hypothetical protein